MWRIGYFQGQREKGKLFSSDPMGSRGKRELVRIRLCTLCTGGQISGAAGSQAGLSRTDGADPGHRGGARQSAGERGGLRETRASATPFPPTHVPGCSERQSSSCARHCLTQRGLRQGLSGVLILGDTHIHVTDPSTPWPLNSSSASSQRPSPTLWLQPCPCPEWLHLWNGPSCSETSLGFLALTVTPANSSSMSRFLNAAFSSSSQAPPA